MAQFFENFAGKALDTLPAEFTFPWGGAGSIKSGNPVAGSDRHLQILPTISGFAREALRWAVGDTSGVTTVRARILVILSSGSQDKWIIGPLVSADGASSAGRTGYGHWQAHTSTRIARYQSGGESIIANVAPPTFQTGAQDLYFELVRDGGYIEVRTWPAAGTRPTTPSASVTDASPLPVAGFFGLSLLSRDDGSPNLELYEIKVATDGDPLPGETPAVLTTPTNLTGVVNSESVDMNWGSVSGADYYQYELRKV